MRYIGPVVVRKSRATNPLTIFTEDYPCRDREGLPGAKTGRRHDHRHGYMLTEAIKAVDLLEKDGLDVAILNMCTLKPLDEEAIVAAAATTGRPSSLPRTGSDIGGSETGWRLFSPRTSRHDDKGSASKTSSASLGLITRKETS